MAQAFQRCELLAALRPAGGGQHRLLIPIQQADGLVEMAQLRDLGAQRRHRIFRRSLGRTLLGHAQIARRMGQEQRRHAAMLGDIDDLLLRDAAERAQPVLRGREAHHRIEGLGEDPSCRPRHREFMDRQTRGRLQHPGLLGVLGARRRLVEEAFPGARFGAAPRATPLPP